MRTKIKIYYHPQKNALLLWNSDPNGFSISFCKKLKWIRKTVAANPKIGGFIQIGWL